MATPPRSGKPWGQPRLRLVDGRWDGSEVLPSLFPHPLIRRNPRQVGDRHHSQALQFGQGIRRVMLQALLMVKLVRGPLVRRLQKQIPFDGHNRRNAHRLFVHKSRPKE